MWIDTGSLDVFVDELLGEINAGLVSLVLNINLYKMIPWFRAFDERVEEV